MGLPVGLTPGIEDGASLPTVEGDSDGRLLGLDDGPELGCDVASGSPVVGTGLSLIVGAWDGTCDGSSLGWPVGEDEVLELGFADGDTL